MSELLRKGSSKDVLSGDEPGQLKFRFSDRVSVFDVGPIPVEFTGLGRLRCAIAGRLFHLLEDAGIPNHYIDHNVDDSTMLVYAANIPEKNFFKEKAIGRLMAVEILFRYELSSGTHSRIKLGSLDRGKIEALLVSGEELQPGARLQPPFLECSTKWQDADSYVSDLIAAKLARISPADLEKVYRNCSEAASVLRNFFKSAGFDLRDGKFEAVWPFCLGDSISLDELRLVGPDGRSYDKDPVRKWYGENQWDWVRWLRESKKKHPTDKSRWPTYEEVPPKSVIADQVERYQIVAEAIGAL